MAPVSMKALLESGVHFGHRTNKWDPRMKPYIFTERNGIHIIDLQQTVKLLNTAFNIIRDEVANGGMVLFVGTKRQAQETVKEEAMRAGMPYVTERWLGGMLTNWSTMHARIKELDRLEGMRDSGEINRLTKKEGLLIGREIIRLLTRLSGIRAMKRLPTLVFIVDVGREVAAVHEANMLKIPIVALVDTNCNPQAIDYVIPSNDDAIRAIKLLVARVADAVLEGKAMRKDEEPLGESAPMAESATGADTARPAKPSRSRKGPRVVEAANVDEVSEGDLLGESTLAKLHPVKKPTDVADAVMAETKAEAATETPAPAAPTADAQIPAETPAVAAAPSEDKPAAKAGE